MNDPSAIPEDDWKRLRTLKELGQSDEPDWPGGATSTGPEARMRPR
jgi:hypothetical protein